MLIIGEPGWKSTSDSHDSESRDGQVKYLFVVPFIFVRVERSENRDDGVQQT